MSIFDLDYLYHIVLKEKRKLFYIEKIKYKNSLPRTTFDSPTAAKHCPL